MNSIVTVTANPALDLSTEAPAVVPDRKLRCGPPLIHPGGGGVNVSRAIANLGGESRTLVAHGGPTGATLVDLLRAEGLQPEGLGVTHPTRQSISVRDVATGLQYRFMLPGPDWSDADLRRARETILAAVTPGALVVPSGSNPPGMPPDFFVAMNADVTAAGGRMILDTSGAALDHAARVSAHLFVLRMDLEEAREMSGARLLEPADIAPLATRLRESGAAEIVMIAVGSHGTVIDTGSWRGLVRPPVVNVVSKIGAGDSFVAGFARALTRDADPVTACAWGVAAAASAVTVDGTGLCRRNDTERFVGMVGRTEI